jgi:endonuclease YncB( thermonuclease family)
MCYPGGEPVTVAAVEDGDTVKLIDGRTIQLLGIDAPELDECGGPEAAQELTSAVSGVPVLLHREPGRDVDRGGRLLRYLQRGDRYVHTDVGNDLADSGWATPYEPYSGNAKYMATLRSNYKFAKDLHVGQFGPPCGPPYSSGGGSGSRSGGVDVDLDYHRDRGLPDGALTGGFCARKWWC